MHSCSLETDWCLHRTRDAATQQSHKKAAMLSGSRSTAASAPTEDNKSTQATNRQSEGSSRMWYMLLSKEERNQRLAEAHKAWDMFWFVHGISFNLINSELFRAAVKATKDCPEYQPCDRRTLATSHLNARNVDANGFKETRIRMGLRYGFLFTTDGWRNSKRRSYHNFILVTVAGPIYLGLKDCTGEAGNSQAIHDEIVEAFKGMDEDVSNRIVIGCTDTPSSNVAAWKLLEQTFPRQVWMGCMNHELGLMFKEWNKKVASISDIYMRCKRLTIWVRNHGDILVMFGAAVKAQWPDSKRVWNIQLYMPGDTRMATMYKLIHRAVKLKPVLRAMFASPTYVTAAQKAIANYNAGAKAERRIPTGPDGLFIDAVQTDILDSTFWGNCDAFLQAAKTSMYLLRLVDTCSPCIGKVYYSSALIGKQLAELSATSNMAKAMLPIFKSRWARWHKPIHTLAYGLDPSYQSHVMTTAEKREVKEMFKRLRPDQSATLIVQFNAYKRDPSSFDKEGWSAVDMHHAYDWWDTFGDVYPELKGVAVDVLSKCASASACEFNWSMVSRVERKGRASLQVASTDKSVNIAAAYQLKKSVLGAGVCRKLPTLDDVIEGLKLVEDMEDEAPLSAVVDCEGQMHNGLGVPGGVATECSDDDEEPLDDATLKRLEEAQAVLYADWDDRDALLK